MATSDEDKLDLLHDIYDASMPRKPAPASAEPVVNAAANAMLRALANAHKGPLHTAKEHALADRIFDVLSHCAVREPVVNAAHALHRHFPFGHQGGYDICGTCGLKIVEEWVAIESPRALTRELGGEVRDGN